MITPNYDIKIFCCNGKKHQKEDINLNNYSLNLIKSGFQFDSEDLFQINRTIIEGTESNIYSITNYKNCKKNGKFIKFFQNGNKQNEFYYIDDKKVGLYEEYYVNGKKLINSFYKEDKLFGNYISYRLNGLIFINCNYIDDKKEGLYEEWSASGKRIFYII
jgi:antitoxin component YwqK of YwqJK toxin-antitoxin module